MNAPSMNFDQIVFAGGGNRCWWQIGFWHALNEVFPQHPRRIVAVSAGAASACLLYSRPNNAGAQWALQYYKKALINVKKNANWSNILTDQKVFPHNELYKAALTNILSAAPQSLVNAPEIWIGFSHIPKFLGPKLAVLLGLLVYNLEKHLFKTVHPELGRKLGFKREFIRAQDSENLEDLVNLIMQSSCTPPFTPVMYRGKNPVLDGGLVDNVPIDGLLPAIKGEEPKKALVLLTRRYPLPDVFIKEVLGLKLTYVQPSETLPISSWDYTRSDLMEPTYQQGVEDAQKFIRHLEGDVAMQQKIPVKGEKIDLIFKTAGNDNEPS